MRINKTKSKNKEHYSIIQDVKINGKRTTRVYENIGNLDNLKLRAGDEDPLEWLKNYVAESENMCYNNKMQNLHTVQMAAIHFFQRRKDDFRCNFNSQMMSQNYSLLRFGKF